MPTPEINMPDSHLQNRWKHLQWVSLVFIVGSLLYKFFDRSAMFHDEIINVAIGENAKLFGYAIRPVFYAIIALSIRFFGAGTLATSFAAYIAFLVIAAYTYQYIKRDLGVLAATAGVAALAWSGLIYYIGIRGMPHLYPAAFLAAAIYHYHQTPMFQQRWRDRCLLATLLWLAMLSHPTGVALVVGFFGMVALDALRAWSTQGTKVVARVLLAWVMPMIVLWGVVEALYYAFSEGHNSYVGYWLAGLDKTSSDVYQRLFEPFGFYFERLATLLLPLLILLAALIVLLVWKVWRGKNGFDVFSSDGWRRATSLLVVAVVSVGVISLEKWKFDRVLVTFMPIAILAIVYLIFKVADSISWKSPLLFALLAAFVTVVSAISFVGQTRDIEAKFRSRYSTYSASSDVIRHLSVRNIGYIGGRGELRVAAYPVEGSGKTITMMKLSARASANEHVMARELMASGNRYVIISMLGDQDTIRTFHKLAYLARFSRGAIFSSRQAYELWDLSPSYLGEGVEAKLQVLPKNASLGLLLNNKRDPWLKWTLDGKKFKSKKLRQIPDARSAKEYSYIFLSTSSRNAKSSQVALTSIGMRKVGEIPAIGGGGRIEMWGRP